MPVFPDDLYCVKCQKKFAHLPASTITLVMQPGEVGLFAFCSNDCAKEMVATYLHAQRKLHEQRKQRALQGLEAFIDKEKT